MSERKLAHKFLEDGVEGLVVIEFVMVVDRILEIPIASNFLVHLSEQIGFGGADELH